MLKVDPRFPLFVQHLLTPHLQMHKLCRSTKHHQTSSPKQHAIREVRANCTHAFVYSTIPSPKRYVFRILEEYVLAIPPASGLINAVQLQRIETIATSQHPTTARSSCFVFCVRVRHPVEKSHLMYQKGTCISS